MATYRRYSDRQRADALSVVHQLGGNTRAAADLTGIPRPTLKHWLEAEDAEAGPDQISSEKKVWLDQFRDPPPPQQETDPDSADDADAPKYRSSLPQLLARRFDSVLDDREITSHARMLALLDLRIEAALSGLDIGDSALLWEKLRRAGDTLADIEAEADGAKELVSYAAYLQRRKRAFHRLIALIDRGVQERAAWDDVLNLIERRRRLASAETRRRHLDREVIRKADLLGWQNAITEAIREHVHDPETLRAILDSVERRYRRAAA